MSIKHCLLALLEQSPDTASGLQARYRETMDEVWPLNIGQVSQTLNRLARDNFISPAETITGHTGRHAQGYEITADGQAELQRWWTEPVHKAASERDELVIKVALAAHNNSPDLVRILDTQRRAIFSSLRELNQQARTVPTERSATRLTIEQRIFELEARSRWLDRVESLSPLTPGKES